MPGTHRLRTGRARVAIATLLALLAVSASSARAAGTVYVAEAGAGSVAAFSVAPDGALSQVPGSPFAADDAPLALAMTPDGTRLYTGDGDGYKGLTHVSAFATGSDGALTPVAGSPFDAGEGPVGPAVTPDGNRLYVGNNFSNDVSAFSIGSDGDLTAVPGSPSALSNFANGVAVTPDGKWLYVSGGSDDLWAFSIGVDGSLTALPGTPITIGNDPGAIAVTPDGAHLYVADYGSDEVSAFSIGLGGTLTPGSPFDTGEGPSGAALTPDGSRLYVTDYNSSDVAAFSIAPGGALTPVAGSPFEAGENPNGAAVTPDGTRLYVADESSDDVAGFSIAPGGGLTPVAGSPFTTGSSPAAVVVSPDQGPVAAFSASASPAGSPSSFDGSGSTDPDGTVARYDWSFGDGTSAADAGPTPTHAYAAPGGYTVTLTVTDEAGCSTAQTFTGQTVSCNGSPAARVTHQLTVPATSSSTTQPPPPAPSPPPALRSLKVSPATFSAAGRRVGGKCVKATRRNAARAACTRPATLTVTYVLSAPAPVAFTIAGRAPGRKVKGRCAPQSAGNRDRKRCTRPVQVPGPTVPPGAAGPGRLTLSRKLAPGTYTLTATPTGGAPERVGFRVTG